MAVRWFKKERNIDHPDWQSGEETIIAGKSHVYGCVRDRCCFNEYMLICDCLCHNGETISG